MTQEQKEQLLVLCKVLIAVAFGFLYAWGGMEMKWLRRFVAPAVLVLGMFLFTRDWKTLIQMPLMMASLCLGYGADSVAAKIIRRGLFGLVNGATSSTHNITRKQWLLVAVQIILVVSLYIVIGTYNPFPSARAEEMFLGVVLALIPILSANEVGYAEG